MQTTDMTHKNNIGYITDIQRFSVHDGPGIRTTVFLKGCPLRCIWCHNPETQNSRPQPQLNKIRCTGCGRCAVVCLKNCHNVTEGVHIFNSEKCEHCFKCVDACPTDALGICGRLITAEEVIEAAIRDRAFYGKKGGLTISGGEPAAQPEFANSILKAAKDSGLSTCIQTCGWGLDKIDVSLCDYIYYDIKTIDNSQHIELTGVRNDIILDQLAKLAKDYPEKITVRTVITKGLTDNISHVEDILKFMKKIGLTRLELNKFHPYGSSKAESVGICRKETGEEFIPDETRIKQLEEVISKYQNKAGG